ncbi:hypothetical protein B296_00018999 [Ensete ventricosum]|uniref:Uncharacterized protein n=1 Tax=Ensete ventricosum TaxID=4639 RepID=A0A426YUI3_ENSVE|nr:hypothetical protein B296_00018999 [Ensete ventricosum]
MVLDMSQGNNRGEALDTKACNATSGFLFWPKGLTLNCGLLDHHKLLPLRWMSRQG